MTCICCQNCVASRFWLHAPNLLPSRATPVPILGQFVDLLLTWVLFMRKPRGETGRMPLLSFWNLVSGAYSLQCRKYVLLERKRA
jgi:hypothetical protein